MSLPPTWPTAGHLHWWPDRSSAEHPLILLRPALARQASRGCAIAQWPGRVAALYNLCASAHRLCSTLAVQAAHPGLVPAQQQAHLSLQQDTLREHIRRLGLEGPQLCQDWLQSLEAGHDLGPALLHEVLHCPVMAPPKGMDTASVLHATRLWLQDHWLGQDAQDWWNQWCEKGWGFWHAWLDHAPGALGELLRTLQQHEPLAGWSPASRLALAHAGTWDKTQTPDSSIGQCHTGPWSRLMAHGLWPEQDAPGWSGLWASRLLEAVRLSLQGDGPVWLKTQAWRVDDQQALAVLDMARGTLVHEVRVQSEQILSATLWAPTDWNAAPEGPLAQSLLAAWSASDRQGETSLRMTHASHLLSQWAAACDPCLPAQVRMPSSEHEENHA